MKCRRCGSLMVYEEFYATHDHFWGWRCIGCGEIIDQVILENRNWTKAGRKGREEGEDGRPDDPEPTD